MILFDRPALRRCVRALVAIVAACVVAPPGWSDEEPEPETPDCVTLLTGGTLTGRVTGIADDGKMTIEGVDDAPVLLDIRSIERTLAPSEYPVNPDAAIAIDLLGGGRLLASHVTIGDEVCRVRWRGAKEFSLPIDAVRAIRFDPQTPNAPFEAAIADGSRDGDLLFAKIDDKFEPITGLIESLDGENVTFDREGKQRTLARWQLYGIVVAMVGRPPDRKGRCEVALDDGSVVFGKVVSLANAKLEVSIFREANVTVPWQSVSRMTVHSGRLAFLSDLTPEDVTEQPIVTLAVPWQRDRSVGGRPLTLRGRVYRKGVGVKSRSSLTFDTSEGYDLFTATIGIDDETRGRGDCIFIVRGDGGELFRRQIQGKDAPQEVRVDIAGLTSVTLIVEPGEDLDLGDHADWCDARFVRVAENTDD